MRLIRPVLLDNHGIGWENYVASYPTGATPELFLANDLVPEALHHTLLGDFFTAPPSPLGVVSPYTKPNHVSHVVYDHTSVLAFVERKWNLPALTYRDANANDLTDFLDLGALKAASPRSRRLPPLAAPGDTSARLACSVSGPGTIPPPGSISG